MSSLETRLIIPPSPEHLVLLNMDYFIINSVPYAFSNEIIPAVEFIDSNVDPSIVKLELKRSNEAWSRAPYPPFRLFVVIFLIEIP